MSEPKLVSPLLDEFVMGEPISQHHGVSSYPAMQKDSDNKYIVKIISIPASQRSLDALLLAGAFPDAQAAQDYFRELADGVADEAQILQQLSKLEGFLSYHGWQVEPMEAGTGYQVYLLSDYRRSLDRHFRREAMTHLAAVNLGLDLCAALSVCRRCGYLYINLQPTNVFMAEDQGYRIGDLGFASLDSLQHASLPDRYRSAYTPPEIPDAYCPLNTTVDTYAVGLILYQAYNNGKLPFEGTAPSDPLPPPMYADYEMAEIILKACDPDPQNRWEDPLQMGKALVSYMQRNSVNDVPIVPAPPVQEEPVPAEAPEEDLPDDDYLAQALEDAEQLEIPLWEEEPEEDPVSLSQEDAEAASETDGAAEEAPAELEEISADETLPSDESAADLEDAPLTEEVSQMLAMADELIAHELPEPVVAPDPVEIPMPEPVKLPDAEEAEEEDTPEESQEAQTDAADEEGEDPEAAAEEDEAAAEEDDEEEESEEPAPKRVRPPRSYRGLIIFLLVIALGLSLFTGGYAFYKFYYLQTVDNITAVSSDGQVTVKLTTSIDDALLTVVCKDTYGNTLRRPVADGKAVFDYLNPGTTYDFYVEISGLHSLVGKIKTSLTTAQQTSILNLSIVTGSEDGSAILSFTVQGPDSSWQVVCSAAGEEPKTFSCINHSAALTGLTPGVTYDIRLVPTTTLYVVGQESVTYTATKIIYAQDLKATDFRDNKLTVSWSAPADTSVESWLVRCYDNDKVDKTITVTGTEAVFGDLDPAKAYNIEVTAAGMTSSVTISITANTIQVHGLQVNAIDGNNLRVTWDFDGNAPEGGWRVLYAVDGSVQSLVVNCETTAATLPLIPGSHYEISIQQKNGGTVLDGTVTYDTPAAETFSGFWLTAENLNFYPCLPTDKVNPGLNDVTHTNTFAPGAKASILMHTRSIYQEDFSEVVNLYVFRDSNGAVVGLTNPVRIWADMLEVGAGMINLPAVPTVVGSYTVEIYFNGAFVASVPIQVSETPAA